MIKRNRHKREFKEKIVLEIISGQTKMTEISKRESISMTTLRNWKESFASDGFKDQNKIEIELRKKIGELESALAEFALENHILKKSRKGSEGIQAKRKIIENSLSSEFGVVRSCKAMKIPTSTFYYKKKPRLDEDAYVLKCIEEYSSKLNQVGYISMTKMLREEKGLKINKKRVYRIMKENGLLCRKKRSFRLKTTDSNHNLRKYPNLLKIDKPDPSKVLVGDVTTFDIKSVNYYLALLMRLGSRRIVGAAISDKNNTELVRRAFLDAKTCLGNLREFYHHSDSDVRYCSREYIKELKSAEMNISMCLGNAYENAHAESLNKTIKYKEINLSEYQSFEEARDSIFKFIHSYNHLKPHSSLDWMTPVKYEKKYFF